MAYLFSKLNEAIDGPQGNRRASDLIGQQQGGGQPAQQDRETPGAQNAIASQPSAIIGGAGQDRPAAPGESATSVNSESRAKVFEKNKGAELQANTGRTTDAIAQTQADQQSQADKFVSAQTYSQVGDDVIGKAVRDNDEGGKKAITDLLYGAAPEAKRFGYDDSSLDDFRNTVRDFNTTGGRTSLIQAGNKDGKMTQGEAGLDAALLGKSNAFRGQREDLIGKFGEASRGLDAAKVRTDAAAQQAGLDRGGDKERVREALGRLRTGVMGDVGNQLASSNAELSSQRDASRSSAQSNVRKQALAALDKLNEQEAVLQGKIPGNGAVSQYDKAAVDARRAYINSIIQDPSKFVTQSADMYTQDDVVTKEQSERFGRINELLGSGARLARRDGVARSADALSGARLDDDPINSQLVAAGKERAALLEEARALNARRNEPSGKDAVDLIFNPFKRGTLADRFVNTGLAPVKALTDPAAYKTPTQAVKSVVAPVKKAVVKAKAVPKKLGNEGVAGPKQEKPKAKESVIEKGVKKARKYIGL